MMVTIIKYNINKWNTNLFIYILLFVINILSNQAIAIQPPNDNPSIKKIIKNFQLKAYPINNSGYSNLIYKSNIMLKQTHLPKGFNAKKYALFSSIYYLLPENGKLKFHATKATKQFHHYLGEPMLIIVIEPTGKLNKVILGKNILQKEQLQLIIPGNSYVAAKVYPSNNIKEQNKLKNFTYKNKNILNKNNLKYSMIGCTTIPSWEIEDCLRANYKELIKKFPQHKKIIAEFT